MGDKVKFIFFGCLFFLKDVFFFYEVVERCKQEFVLGKIFGRGWLSLYVVFGEKVREIGGIEGIGDVVLGENVFEEGLLFQECVLEVEKSEFLILVFGGGEGEEVSYGFLQVVEFLKKEEYIVGKLLSSFVELVYLELVKDEDVLEFQVKGSSNILDRDLVGELDKDEIVFENDQIKQVVFQFIFQVILEVIEELWVIIVGKIVV